MFLLITENTMGMLHLKKKMKIYVCVIRYQHPFIPELHTRRKWLASFTRRSLYPGEAPIIAGAGGLLVPRAGLDSLVSRKISGPCQESILNSSVLQICYNATLWSYIGQIQKLYVRNKILWQQLIETILIFITINLFSRKVGTPLIWMLFLPWSLSY